MVLISETIQYKIKKIQDGLPDNVIIILSEWLYPKNIGKYCGNIFETNGRFRCMIQKYKFDKTVKTRDDAEKLIKEKNIEYKCEVKNCFRMCVDNKNIIYEVKLTRNQTCFIDRHDLDVIEKYIWHANQDEKTFYVKTGIGNKLHNIILNHIPNEITIDHLNQDGLDNRRRNLKLKTKRGQAINHSIRTNNKSGIVGVYFNKQRQSWISSWQDKDGKRKSSKLYHLRDYSEEEAKQLAKQERDKAISKLAHYNE